MLVMAVPGPPSGRETRTKEDDVQYLILLYDDEANGPQPGTPDWDKMMEGYDTATKTFRDDGVMVAGQALEGVASATSVRKRNGKVETMDGPFAETKEALGGYYLLDCPDLDAALRYAAMIPAAETGTVEVRPIMQFA